MPHRVTSFFRSPNDNVKTSVPSSQTLTRASTRTFSYASSLGLDTATTNDSMHQNVFFPSPPPSVGVFRMGPEPERKDKEKEVFHHHRLSFPGLHLSSKLSKDHYQPHPSASLDWKIESPPAVMYGDPDNSTGALVSGQLLLLVKEAQFEIESFEARLSMHVIQKRPFANHCPECTNQTTELKNWKFLNEPTALNQRK
jgi:arrestin-related trafficking adapter 1